MDPWRPYDIGFIRDPYPHYKYLRDNYPVYKTIHNEFVITRHADVRALAGDPRCVVGNRARWIADVTSSSTEKFHSLTSALASFMVFRNPPEHTQLRRFVSEAWNERAVGDIVRQNLDYLSKQTDWSHVDFVRSIAQPLPALTMAAILGLPANDYPLLIAQSQQLIKSLDTYITFRDLRNMEQSMQEMTTYFLDKVSEKKSKPDSSLINKLIDFNPGYSDTELAQTCLFLLVAGEETTANLMAMSVRNLVERDAWNDPAVKEMPTEKLLEELLRLDPPTQVIGRINTTALTVQGMEIPPESKLTLCLGAANRDERAFPHPDNIVAGRSHRHTTFGAGIHHCLGDWLARAEALEMLKFMFQNFQSVHIEGDVVFRPNLTLRGLTTLNITARHK